MQPFKIFFQETFPTTIRHKTRMKHRPLTKEHVQLSRALDGEFETWGPMDLISSCYHASRAPTHWLLSIENPVVAVTL